MWYPGKSTLVRLDTLTFQAQQMVDHLDDIYFLLEKREESADVHLNKSSVED